MRRWKMRDNEDQWSYPSDVHRLVRIAKEFLEVEISPTEAEWIWSRHSDDLCAGWLCLHSDDDRLAEILKRVMEEHGVFYDD